MGEQQLKAFSCATISKSWITATKGSAGRLHPNLHLRAWEGHRRPVLPRDGRRQDTGRCNGDYNLHAKLPPSFAGDGIGTGREPSGATMACDAHVLYSGRPSLPSCLPADSPPLVAWSLSANPEWPRYQYQTALDKAIFQILPSPIRYFLRYKVYNFRDTPQHVPVLGRADHRQMPAY